MSKCLSPRDTLKESADNCRKNGCWRVNGNYQPVNGVNDGILLAFDAMGDGNVVYQQLFNNVGDALYVRRCWFNGWSDWVDIALKSDLNTWEDITSDCTLANGISVGTFKVYKNTTQKLIKMNGYLKITSEQQVSTILVRFPSDIELIGYQYVLAYDANKSDVYGIYGTSGNVLQNDTKDIPIMPYLVIPNTTMSFTLGTP